jgi:hypothetical protein
MTAQLCQVFGLERFFVLWHFAPIPGNKKRKGML